MRTRFAPSPTGPLHLGHAYSALLAHDMAQAAGGTFLLRIEDIDQSRSRPEWEDLIYEDLKWLGITWDGPVQRQSERQAAYDVALDRLWDMRLLYPCACNRRDIRAAASAPNEGEPLVGPDGIVYPGTCRPTRALTGPRPRNEALRLDMAAALEMVANGQVDVTNPDHSTSTFPTFKETGQGPQGETGVITLDPDNLVAGVGDVVLARRNMGTSYHLAVVIDDAFQEISHVVRGEDLFDATAIHVILQRLLGVTTPEYHHHGLIRDETGKRLAKRHDSRAIRKYREEGLTPAEVKRLVGL